MRPGVWNGVEITHADLDDIVSNFAELQPTGRVPLKLGHNDAQPMTDGQPALGWIERVYRQGEKLMADFKDMPSVVYDAIKAGLYKSVSVELFKDVATPGGLRSWVLDAVALLGADIPAVSGLKDLQALTLSKRSEFRRAGAYAFSMGAQPNEAAELRRQNAELQAALVDMKIESDVRGGEVLPAARYQFGQLFGANRTLTNWENFKRTQPKPAPGRATSQQRMGDDNTQSLAAPDEALVVERETFFAARNLDPTSMDAHVQFGRFIAKKRPRLLRQYHDAPGQF